MKLTNEECRELGREMGVKLARRLAEQAGYRFEDDADGTTQMYRPDGTLALTAIPDKGRRVLTP
jgi:hypothetical protein